MRDDRQVDEVHLKPFEQEFEHTDPLLDEPIVQDQISLAKNFEYLHQEHFSIYCDHGVKEVLVLKDTRTVGLQVDIPH